MGELVALIPVLGRPHRVRPLLDSIKATTPTARVLFIPDPDDLYERAAIREASAEELAMGGGYAAKCNAGIQATQEPYVLLGADDITPHPGWFGAALSLVRQGAQVVGLNDLIPRPTRPEHATHFLLTREAAELPCLDGSRGPLCEAYAHWRCDDELIATATKRGMYAYAKHAVVEHIDHPMTGGPDDATYAKGRANARHDNRVFQRRCRLWAT